MWWNSNGFTMLEALIVLIVFTACAASIPLLYDGAYRTIEAAKAEKNMEWELFIIQLRNEMHVSQDWHLSASRLQYSPVDLNDSIVSINKYNDKIRRQVNGQGHEIMLQNVESATFSIEGGNLYIHVTFSNGEEEGASIHSLHKEAP
ncbi:competence type IV pilus minor pilin ComGF [Domibacillus iocasae]|nr:competence type IV pilus minor pilin ComGF [Domibacillus iocasae]